MKIILANPRGFCAGVNMAIESLERALELYGTPLYVYHEIVHNRPVVERFRRRGVVFVDGIDEVPAGATLLYSAHGVAPAIRAEAAARRLRAIDATCPLVTKVHLEAVCFAREGYTILLIGHEGHDEVLGTTGEAPEHIRLVQDAAEAERLDLPADARVAYLTQTTLSVDDAEAVIAVLRRRYPQIVGPSRDDICYATQNRQAAVKTVAGEVDVLLVIGAANSSNANRLVEVSRGMGTPSYLINDKHDIDPRWLETARRVGITAGASTPEFLVAEVVEQIKLVRPAAVREVHVVEEDVRFGLPRELEEMARRAGKTLPSRSAAGAISAD